MKKCLETNILFRNFPFRERIKLDLRSHIIEFYKEKATVFKITMEMSTNTLELICFWSFYLSTEKILFGGHIRDI